MIVHAISVFFWFIFNLERQVSDGFYRLWWNWESPRRKHRMSKQTSNQSQSGASVFICVHKKQPSKKASFCFLLLLCFFPSSLSHTEFYGCNAHIFADTDSFSRKKRWKSWNIPLELSMHVCEWCFFFKYIFAWRYAPLQRKRMPRLGYSQREKMSTRIYILFLLLNQIPHCLPSPALFLPLPLFRCVCVTAFAVCVFEMAHISH